VRWALASDGKVYETGRLQSGVELASFYAGLQRDALVAFFFDGAQAVVRTLPGAPKQQSKLVAASHLLLEDEVAEPVDGLHVAVKLVGSDGRIVAVNQRVLSGYLADLAEAGIDPDYILPDCEALAGHDAAVFIADRRILLSAAGRTASLEQAYAEDVISAVIPPDAVAEPALYGPADRLPTLLRRGFIQKGEGGDAAFFDLAARAITQELSPNLRQGAFRKRRKAGPGFAQWRRPAMLAAGLGAAMLVYTAADAWRLQREATHYLAEAQRIHEEAFPEAASADPRSHARRVLSSGANTNFLRLTGAINAAIAENEAVEIDRIRYDSARGQFAFSIRSRSDSDIESFRRFLETRGLKATDSGGYRRDGAFWSGEMTAQL
jgi:type II secretion system protein L